MDEEKTKMMIRIARTGMARNESKNRESDIGSSNKMQCESKSLELRYVPGL